MEAAFLPESTKMLGEPQLRFRFLEYDEARRLKAGFGNLVVVGGIEPPCAIP